MKTAITFLLLLSFSFNGSFAQTGIPVPGMAATDSLVGNFLSNWNVTGATVSFAKDGKLIYNRAFGWADMAHTEPMQPYSLMRIASNSKAITGIAIMKLMEEGMLQLSDTVFGPGRILDQPYYLSVITDNRIYNITIKELLEHTAGWDRSVNCDGYTGCDPIGFPLHVATVLAEANPVGDSSMIKFLLKKGLNFNPGTQYAYSNIGYLILGKIIQAKTGMSYEAYVHSLLQPLGICDMHLGKDLLTEKQEREAEYITPGTALSAYGTGEMVPWQYGGMLVNNMNAHGGWISTSSDYVRMILAVDSFNTVPDILSPATITIMTTGSSANPGYGKGWAVSTVGTWWHTGSIPGTATIMVRYANGYAYAIHLNDGSTGTNAFWNAFQQLGSNCILSTTSLPAHNLFAPVTQAGDLTVSKTGSTTAHLSWTSGSGDNRTVLATEENHWTGFPKDGISYGGNASYGLGEDVGNNTFVVYSGAGNEVDISGLDPVKTYYFTVLEGYKNSTTGNKQVYKYGCRSTALLDMSSTGVAALNKKKLLSIYPNPAGSTVTIRSEHVKTEVVLAILSDMLGQQVMTIHLKEGTQIVDVSHLSAGVYQLRTMDGEVCRLVKK